MSKIPDKQLPDLKQEEFLQARRPEENPAEKNRKKRRPLWLLTLVLLVVCLVGLIAYFLTRDYETTDDAFIDGHVIEVSSRVAAQVVRLHIDDNAEVKKGDVLVELDPRDFQVALEKAQAQLVQAQARVKQAEAGADQAKAQVVQAQADLAQRAAQFEIARINYERNSSLYQRDLRAVAKEDVDTTKANFDAAQATLAGAQASVTAAAAAGESAAAQVGAAEAAVHAAEAAVDNADLQLSYTRIVAAESGRITRKNVDVGTYVQPAQTMFALVNHDVWVTANFKETQLTKMKEGQPVTIAVDAYPGRKLKGHVDSVQLGSGSRFSLLPAENATGNFVKVVQRIPVKIVLDESPEVLARLGPGMSVEPKIDITAAGRQMDHGNAQYQ